MNIYVASSWRNPHQPDVVAFLRRLGHDVYDFREANSAFRWERIDPNWQDWTEEDFVYALADPLAARAFANDFAAMESADVGVLILPAGKSAHLELGWMAGARKPTAILLLPGDHSGAEGMVELMYLTADIICSCTDELECWLNGAAQVLLQERTR